jgi:hypothetical protein
MILFAPLLVLSHSRFQSFFCSRCTSRCAARAAGPPFLILIHMFLTVFSYKRIKQDIQILAFHLTQSYCFLPSLQCAWKTEIIQFSVRLLQVSSFLSLFFSCIFALTSKVFWCLSYWNSSQDLANACKFVLGEGSVYICYHQICFYSF